MNPKVDAFLREAETWRDETETLRKIVLRFGLTEELKWGKPCYALQGGNVAIIQGFKDYCALMFFKGSLLKDPRKILHSPGKHSQAARQIRFTSVREIRDREPILKSYLREALDLEKRGLKVVFKTAPEPIPDELKKKWDEIPALKTAFFALTPGRQRAYILYFSAAKQSKTRESRIEKCIQRILQRTGLND